MPDLFAPAAMGPLTLANRFLRSATFEGRAGDQGQVTQSLTDMMVDLARGQVGLIISGHTFVSPEGRAGRRQLAVDNDGLVAGLTGMVQAVHGAGGKMALQLAHSGAMADSALTGQEAIGPSAYANEKQAPCRPATTADLKAIVAAFAQGADRAKQAGFDAVQIHGAHGYLLSQFLSPAFNHRTDNYGGSLANRVRLPLEVIRAVRETVGPHYPVLMKINAEDFIPDGLTPQDSAQAAALFAKASVDGLELSGGCRPAKKFMAARPGDPKTMADQGYYRETAKLIRQATRIPLAMVGGIRNPEAAEDILAQDLADFIALCRPLIREPGLVKRWASGDRRRSACTSDNACYGPAFDGRGLYCVTREKKKEEI
jgi:2,4-dienoyl-CoA reductase-like NADH-dependent reductase (Old Yellow Enzyme family)